MNLALFVAKRYFISKKSQNVINIITKIAISGVTIGTMAMIIVLSAFNGIEELVVSLLNSFDPEIKITANVGKSFDSNSAVFDEIKKLNGVAYYSETLEETALLKYKDKQYIATIKGVQKNFVLMTRIDTMLEDGEFYLNRDSINYAVVGQGVAYNLGLNIENFLNPITVYIPKKNATISTTNPEQAFQSLPIYPSGIFSVDYNIDTKYMLVSLDFARELLEEPTKVSAIEIGLHKNADVKKVQEEIQNLLGKNYAVKDRYQQHDLLYKVFKSEKWAVFLILSFILVIATFNVIGSLTMLIIDKKKDIQILWNLGADNNLIRKIFFIEGLLISLSGAVLGIVLGIIICLLQQQFGIIKFAGTFVTDAIPVRMIFVDFVYVFFTVMLIGIVAAWFPAKQLTKKYLS